MKKLKGPDLKIPDLRMPAFLVDLYWDLRDRHLLPLVALALVAIVAVPFLLSGASEDEEPPPEPSAGISSADWKAAELTVVKATPGLRDYHKRLRSRSPSDPFKQQYTAPDLSGTELGAPGDNGFESSTSVTRTSSSTSVSSEPGSTTKTTKTTKSEDGVTTTETQTETSGQGGTGGTSGGSKSDPVPAAFTIDVRVVRTVTAPDGTSQSDDPETLAKILSPSALPSAKTQVVTYMGISPKTSKPMLLVSDQVTSVFGEAKCLSGASTCQLLEVETGMPITFVFGPDNARYKVTVLKVEPVPSLDP